MDFAIHVADLVVNKENSKILKRISVDFPRGVITGVLGPSGAGKTTLLRTVVGRQEITSGSVKVLGQPAGSKVLRGSVGYMPQSPAFYPDLTVAQNIEFFSKMLTSHKADVGQELGKVDLAKQSKQLASSLSGGQKSRLSLAIALLGNPEVLVLDEPTVGVDPVLRKQLWEQFRSLAQTGVTILVSSHVMDEANRCDNLVLVRDGKILAQGSPKRLMDKSGTTSVEETFLELVGEA